MPKSIPVSVAIEAGAATLNESATHQTRLNQVFIVGPQDRYLSFTLSNVALDDAATGPDDAFEVALLNAHTGASLASTIGLTHVTNPDGSRTYLVDLASIAAGICAGRQHNRYHFASC